MKRKSLNLHFPKIDTKKYTGLKWGENSKLVGIEECINNIVIKDFMANGKYGLVYDVIFDGMPCVLKIVPIRNVIIGDEKDIDYNIPVSNRRWSITGFGHEEFTKRIPQLEVNPIAYTTPLQNWEAEKNILNIIDTLNLVPKIYKIGECMIDHVSQNQIGKMEVGYIVSEKYDKTLYDELQGLIMSCSEKVKSRIGYVRLTDRRDIVREIVESYLDKIYRIEDDLFSQILLALENKITNSDTHLKNIMMKEDEYGTKYSIIDWGLAKVWEDESEMISAFITKDRFYIKNGIYLSQYFCTELHKKLLSFNLSEHVATRYSIALLRFSSNIYDKIQKELYKKIKVLFKRSGSNKRISSSGSNKRNKSFFDYEDIQ